MVEADHSVVFLQNVVKDTIPQEGGAVPAYDWGCNADKLP